jgi:8-oxo-dGTP pyrophosphatase MutT (NUDIX family)
MLPFNIRVYGLLVNDLGQVLVSDECRNGYSFTKFPGGGLEFGEGFKEALKREFIEELNISVDVGDLFYFNDFFQESAFNPKHQIHSFYYKVSAKEWEFIETDKHDVPLREEGEKHRWIAIDQLEINHFTFPIDKLVAEILRQKS